MHALPPPQMTPGELKFALLLESKLNSIPDPEYRQLVVEVLMVVGLVAKASSQPSFGHAPIAVDRLINLGLQRFLQDQVSNCIRALEVSLYIKW